MNTQAQYLFNEAMKLPADSRELLAAELMGSVEPSEAEAAEIKQVWIAEIDRRVAALESGESQPIPIEEAWPKLTGRPWKGVTDENA